MANRLNAAALSRGAVPEAREDGRRFVQRRSEFVPAYIRTYELRRLEQKIKAGQEMLRTCSVCPRDCEVDRWDNKSGVCRTGRYARVSSAFAHFGEEDCLRGGKGSGTIFFSGCNLGCVFCQNFEISQQAGGQELEPGQLADLMLDLQRAGCHNINFVTPEHVVPQILEALPVAIERGLRLPLVYNTGAYDSLESIRLMEGVADIYMPDFKLWNPEHCAKYLRARDYPEAARQAIKAMHQQVGVLQVDEDGLALRGVLVRHLVMPGLLQDTRSILDWLAAELSPNTYVNVMDQYRPANRVGIRKQYSEINRRILATEYDRARAYAQAAGLWRLDSR
jgi:putative pyruvate formate lyase activating enzyme